ncbi:tRNA pseudouridine(38-40) synthase TruA [Erythrobacter rubeus]|uniref:tRNA pseudouridine synthase A n=1 Tax=Erythrobacter rubeus TaxID=2760803 RepID=A0ABR8KP65_9SPHN|nr:tRNA pseudouridine(38-40) synthase TruA [Erythrobacter rubeus]MBD2842425.1 tRNA pseudouridine(38-40) synthase TruA [Erythrobacter rubeus]
MTRFALIYEFDGTPYQGLQRQKHGPSVQQAIEDALHAITGEDAVLHSSGRTDAGVHAIAMRSHVDLETELTPFRLMGAINAHLRPQPIAVNLCEIVPEDWHARFSCTGRKYLYRIVNRRAPLALAKNRAWQVAPQLDIEAMREAAKSLIGEHDFTTFRSVKCQAKDPVKTLDRLDVAQTDGPYGPEIHIHAEARSFLHHQVRSMVGCLKFVGAGTWEVERVAQALAARDRQQLGLNAPPHGLYFVAALYPEGGG